VIQTGLHAFSPAAYALLILGSLAAGFINVFAGGGGIIVLLVMMLAGLSPMSANMSSTIAVMPGLVSSLWFIRGDLEPARHRMPLLLWIGLLGGLAGALLLLLTPSHWFSAAVPYLVLMATLSFVYGTWFFKKSASAAGHHRRLDWTQILGLVVLSIYGGYYGGGVSIMTLALMAFGPWGGIRGMNALKLYFGIMTNVAGIFLFAFYGDISWTAVWVVALGATLGGYVGSRFIRQVNTTVLNILVVLFSLSMTVYLFVTR
jgi:uncharacterized membrane protein YfcA